jgi:hypothetical protein
MAEKIQINLSNDQKKSSDEQFLQAPRNWQKCSALAVTRIFFFMVYDGNYFNCSTLVISIRVDAGPP